MFGIKVKNFLLVLHLILSKFFVFSNRNLSFVLITNSRITHLSTNDLMTSSLERTRQPLVNHINNDRIVSLTLSSKSNEHSPKHRQSLLTPTNHEQSKKNFKL
jgi:hypothetical protein